MKSICSRFLAITCVALMFVTYSAPLSAATIGFVTNEPEVNKPFDLAFVDRLVNQGYNVITIGDDEDLPEGVTVDDFDAFIISQDANSNNWRDGPVGTETSQGQMSYEWGNFDEYGFRTEHGNSSKSDQKNVDVLLPNHHAADNVPAGPVSLITGLGANMTTVEPLGGDLNANAAVVATDLVGDPVIMALPTGALKVDGVTPSPGRRLSTFPDDDNDPSIYTQDAWAMLDSGVEWVLGIPEPSTVALMLTGLVGVAALRRRKA